MVDQAAVTCVGFVVQNGMLRVMSLEHTERQEGMLRKVLTEFFASQQELAREQCALGIEHLRALYCWVAHN